MSKIKKNLLDQKEVNALLNINALIEEEEKNVSLIEEIEAAILDSGKLSLNDWKSLRRRLKEIEKLVPHIDLIIRLKEIKKA